MYESISKNNELENEMTLDMSYFWYSDAIAHSYCKHSNVDCRSFDASLIFSQDGMIMGD